jgi:HlyD family secretion protein
MDINRPDLKAAKLRKRWIWGGVAAVLTCAAMYGAWNLKPAAPTLEKSAIWSNTVKRGPMMIEVRGPGVLLPKEIRWIAAESAARVERILVKPGAVVQADTVLLVLSDPTVMDALLTAKTVVTAAKADLAAQRMQLKSQHLDQRAAFAQTQADLVLARLQSEAQKELAEKGVIAAIDFKRTELAREQLELRVGLERERMANAALTVDAQLDASKARLAQLENTLQLRQRLVDGLQVKAGIAGILQQIAVEEGQQVASGLNLARVARPDALMAALKIPETQAKDVLIDQAVRVDTRNGIVQGRVIRIDPAVTLGAVQVDVELISALPAGARPDLSVDGIIEIASLANVLYVERPASGQPNGKTSLFRFTVPADQHAVRVDVSLGQASVSFIEVRGGLNEGDQVILSDTSQFDGFKRIRVR